MSIIRIVVANEPRSYREVIVAVLRALRPQVEAIVVEPDGLDCMVVHLEPHLVVCNQLTDTIENRGCASILLYPDGQSHAVVSVAGQRRRVDAIELGDLLSVIDQVELLRDLH